MFRGRYIHTMDEKGRISVPSGFRVKLMGQDKTKGKSKGQAPILTNLPHCLALYPFEDWVRIEEGLQQGGINPKSQALRRFLISGAQECPIDGPGRITVPPHLREHARLEREVAIAGVGTYIELWNKARFDEEIAKVGSNFDDLAEGAPFTA
jgi:MraZ protein